MHQFVSEYMVGLVQGRRKRHYNPLFQTLRNPSRSFANNAANSVGLLKIGMICIKNNGIFYSKSIFKYALMHVIPFFCPSGEIINHRIVFQIMMNFKMRRSGNFKFKFFVAWLIPSKRLCIRCKRTYLQDGNYCK